MITVNHLEPTTVSVSLQLACPRRLLPPLASLSQGLPDLAFALLQCVHRIQFQRVGIRHRFILCNLWHNLHAVPFRVPAFTVGLSTRRDKYVSEDRRRDASKSGNRTRLIRPSTVPTSTAPGPATSIWSPNSSGTTLLMYGSIYTTRSIPVAIIKRAQR